EGLAGRFAGRTLAALAVEVVQIAERGLKRLDPADAPLLEPLLELARSGKSPAHRVLEAPRGPVALLDAFTS
ncbi:MAG: glutamate--cysteine ligase, partial [Myxococcaceae bacterium]|nr:glutamate--cysteine ligase [Myxococcaceae bacterium]